MSKEMLGVFEYTHGIFQATPAAGNLELSYVVLRIEGLEFILCACGCPRRSRVMFRNMDQELENMFASRPLFNIIAE
jgi:hypothetical protein